MVCIRKIGRNPPTPSLLVQEGLRGIQLHKLHASAKITGSPGICALSAFEGTGIVTVALRLVRSVAGRIVLFFKRIVDAPVTSVKNRIARHALPHLVNAVQTHPSDMV